MNEDEYHKTQREFIESIDERLKVVEDKLNKRGRPPKDKEKQDADTIIR